MSRRPPLTPDPGKQPGDPPFRRPVSLQDEFEERFVRPGGRRPSGGGSRPRGGGGFSAGCLTILVVAVLLFIFGPVLLNISVDWQWFGSRDLQSVYGTRLGAALVVWLLGFLVAAAFLVVNWIIAWRILQPRELFPGQQLPMSPGVARLAIGAGTALGALIMAFIAAGEWSTILTYLNHTPFGTTDAIFHQDIGFYVFELPFYEFLRGWGLGLVVLAAIGAAILYAQRPSLFVTGQRVTPDPRVVGHFTVLGVVFLALMAVGYWFAGYTLLFSEHNALFGASYTDVNARLPAYRIMLVVTIIIAIILLINLRRRALVWLGGAVGIWILVLILVGGLYPTLIQNFVVQPQEFSKETQYIQNNIAATRAAFNLDQFDEQPVKAETTLSRADINSNSTLVSSIRLWDYRPLLQTYSQLQSLRPYFTFQGVDIDRYPLASGVQQVMISARELNINGLQPQAQTWLNQHLVYTHGYGVVASSVNQIENAGQPHFLLHDLPPVAEDPVLALTRPQIYYGEAEDNYVFVHTGTQEFDYPAGDHAVTTTYTGTGGVEVGGLLNRLQYAAYFGDFNIVLSDLIKDNSRVLFHRDISDIVNRIAPFLVYDPDPYVTVVDGKVYWIQDAYTATDQYPNSTPYAQGDSALNYIRNSVKVVIDAYDGTVTYYVIDPTDPIIQTYRRIFPQLFTDISAMPADLRVHLRYPEWMFNAQAITYETFHMTDPQVFYNRDDAWRLPLGEASDTSAPLESYYTMMQLPGDTTTQFMLIAPFTPASKPNMIAWMAGRGDAPDYGHVNVIRFPANTVIYGPQQINATINQDTTISQQLTLWNQSGSSVVRGNLLVIPLGSSVLYVQPLFLEATNNGLPELKRVITAAGGQVGMGDTLASALDAMFGAQAQIPPPVTGGTPTPGTPITTVLPLSPSPGAGTPIAGCSGTAQTLSADALQHYQAAQAALKTGDWTTYGQEQTLVEQDLRCLQQITQ